MDVADHQIIGAPLYLTAKEGTNITLEALNGGQIVMHSPIKMAGPIIPRNLEYQVKGDSSSGGEVRERSLEQQRVARELAARPR